MASLSKGFELVGQDRAWLVHSLGLLQKSLERSKQKELFGSPVCQARDAEIKQVVDLRSRLEKYDASS